MAASVRRIPMRILFTITLLLLPFLACAQPKATVNGQPLPYEDKVFAYPSRTSAETSFQLQHHRAPSREELDAKLQSTRCDHLKLAVTQELREQHFKHLGLSVTDADIAEV